MRYTYKKIKDCDGITYKEVDEVFGGLA